MLYQNIFRKMWNQCNHRLKNWQNKKGQKDCWDAPKMTFFFEIAASNALVEKKNSVSDKNKVKGHRRLRHTLLPRTFYSSATLCIVNFCSKEQFASNWLVTVCSLTKVIETKYSKHWPYTVAHTFECVCSKINNSWFNP